MRRRYWFFAMLAALMLAACASPPAGRVAAPAIPPTDPGLPILLDRYTGILPGADCANVFTELALYVRAGDRRPAIYELHETCLAAREGERVRHTGAWSMAADGASLRLESGEQTARLFRRAGEELFALDALAVPSSLRRAGSPTMGTPLVVTAADIGKAISLMVGRELLVHLPPPASGHAWSLVMPVDGILIARLAESAGTPTWRLLAARPGQQALRFEYGQVTPVQRPPLQMLSFPVAVH